MMTYSIAKQSPATSELARMLVTRGMREAPTDSADVVLLAAESVEELADALERLGAAARKTIALGPLPSVNIVYGAVSGTMEGTLEAYRPLGVFNMVSDSLAVIPGFVGPIELADRLEAGAMKAFSTSHYGSWIFREGEDAGEFVCRVVDASIAATPPAQEDTAPILAGFLDR